MPDLKTRHLLSQEIIGPYSCPSYMSVLNTKFLTTKLQFGSPSYFFQIQFSILYAELNRFNSRVFYLQTNEELVGCPPYH